MKITHGTSQAERRPARRTVSDSLIVITMSDPKALDDLLTATEYEDYIKEEAA
ncbi:hypothetical protein ACGFSD_07610 [Streptomyces caniferus]|uniref:hypothetical protein n=1 Tax=Streptomyces caniferus TaxID=285557 RepID=UPI0033CC0105